jgi:hypothetical protein
MPTKPTLLTVVLFAAVSFAAAHRSEPKGYDAVLFYGGPLAEPVRVGEPAEATAFYIALVRLLQTYGSDYPYPKMKGRPCIGIAVFRHRPNSVLIPVSELHPDNADLTYWFYPRIADAPAVTHGKILSDELVAKLVAYGVPTDLRPEHSTPCKWGP